MKGHIFLEFLVAFLTMIVIVQLLLYSQESSLVTIGKEVEQIRIKMELERLASACNLIYFNWRSADFDFSFNLPNLKTMNNVLMATANEVNLTSECLSNISGVDRLEVVGVRRWF